MARLPVPGGDENTWGDLLNNYLSVEHNADGTLKSSGSISAKADDADVVHKSSTETITGAKDFTGGLTVNGDDVVIDSDPRLTDTRVPSDSSVTSAKIADGTIVNTDIGAGAAIALSKLATDPLARANHTGTQTASTISDFTTAAAAASAVQSVDGQTGAVSLSSTYVAKTAIDAKGDLLVGTADNTLTRLPAAANGAILVTDSTQATGLGWATADPFGAVTLAGIIPVLQSALANSANFTRWWGGGTFTKIALLIGTSSGNICVGSYTSTGSSYAAVPNARQGTSGTVPCPASGYAEIALTSSTTWAAGDFGAVVWDNSTATMFGNAAPGSSNAQRGLSYYQGSAFPLPSTYGGATTSDRATRLWGGSVMIRVVDNHDRRFPGEILIEAVDDATGRVLWRSWAPEHIDPAIRLNIHHPVAVDARTSTAESEISYRLPTVEEREHIGIVSDAHHQAIAMAAVAESIVSPKEASKAIGIPVDRLIGMIDDQPSVVEEDNTHDQAATS